MNFWIMIIAIAANRHEIGRRIASDGHHKWITTTITISIFIPSGDFIAIINSTIAVVVNAVA